MDIFDPERTTLTTHDRGRLESAITEITPSIWTLYHSGGSPCDLRILERRNEELTPPERFSIELIDTLAHALVLSSTPAEDEHGQHWLTEVASAVKTPPLTRRERARVDAFLRIAWSEFLFAIDGIRPSEAHASIETIWMTYRAGYQACIGSASPTASAAILRVAGLAGHAMVDLRSSK
jgi:hypothetical protein